ncbi:MAG: TonB-dependent receptor [Halioglobus sp.]
MPGIGRQSLKSSKRWLRSWLLPLIATISCWSSHTFATVDDSSVFDIDAGQLSAALIEFSRQSGLYIVFSDKLTRHLQVDAVVGKQTNKSALEKLLNRSGLDWEAMDDHIIAVFEASCADNSSNPRDCPDSAATLANYPVYTPGIEETYIYGSRTTGSRIRRSDYVGAAPVEVISSPDIESSGAQTLGEILKFVPAVAGNAISTAISNGGDGTATVTLRGLPASNTLVLINGRRVANDGLAGEAVDLNSIPPAAVERIEILKDGASAVYGSDAIAGVVNVIMKQDFRGFLAETFYGEASRGDLRTQTHTVQYGTALPNGSFFLSASAYDQDPIYSRDRSVSRSADTRARGGTDQRSSATPASRVVLSDGSALIATNSGYRATTDEDLFDYQAFTSAIVPLDRSSIYSNASYDFNEQITIAIDASYVKTESKATLAPTPVFTGFEQEPIPIDVNNQYNSFGETLLDVRRRLVEFPVRSQRNESEVTRFAASLEGLFDDWNWDLAYNWSRSEADETITSIVNADRLRQALGPASNCQGAEIDGCVPVNLLGTPGSITHDQVDFIRTKGDVSGYSTLSSLSASASNAVLSLPYGRGNLAFGFEYRNEATSKRPDQLIASGGTIGGNNFELTRGDRDIIEFFSEVTVPAWRNSANSLGLDIEAAFRYSDYSDFGNNAAPKLGLVFQIGNAVLLRGTYAKGFRAPSLNELYEGLSEDQAFINDPCTVEQNVGVLPGCVVQADPTRNQFLTEKGGNPKLDAEKSDSYGAGIVWTPTNIGGLTVTADLFLIEQSDVVSSSAQFIVSQNARSGAFADRVQRDAAGNLVLVTADNINVGRRKVQGADFTARYVIPDSRWGKFILASSVTYLDEYLARLDSSSQEIDFAGTFRDEASEGLGGIPQWKGQANLRWIRKRWQAGYEIHFVDSMQEVRPGTNDSRDIDKWAVHDMQASYKFDFLQGLRWTLGIDNLLDENAPLATSAFNDNIDGRSHELRGRYWYTKLSQRF